MAFPTYEKQADIPKGFEDEYEEQDGKWVPIDHAAALSKALKEEREKREAAEALAKKAAREAAEAATKSQAAAAGMTSKELKEVYANIEKNIREELAPEVEAAKTLREENRRLKLDHVVKGMFRTAGALADKVDDFWKLHGDEFDLTTDGKPMVRAEPGKDPAKHVASIVKKRAEWVQGTKASGGGAGGQHIPPTTGSGQGGAITFEDLVKNPAMAVAQANEQ